MSSSDDTEHRTQAITAHQKGNTPAFCPTLLIWCSFLPVRPRSRPPPAAVLELIELELPMFYTARKVTVRHRIGQLSLIVTAERQKHIMQQCAGVCNQCTTSAGYSGNSACCTRWHNSHLMKGVLACVLRHLQELASHVYRVPRANVGQRVLT